MQAQDPEFAPDEPSFFLGDPNGVMKRLRQADPLPWYEGSENAWCVLKHADVMAISRNPATYTSTKGILFAQEQIRPSGIPPTILEMDPPVHNLHRKLVIGAFTPHATAQLESMVRKITRECIEAIEPGRIADFVESIAVPVPIYVIAEVLGVPRSDRSRFKTWSDSMVEASGGRRSADTDACLGEMFGYFAAVLAERRRAPKDDLVSKLAFAEVEGERLSDPAILMFCITLLSAGNETTRNLISGGSLLLARHAEERNRLLAEPALLPNAIEEMLRWWTPVRSFARRATRNVTLRGKQVREGDLVLLLYASANRDEEVWGDDSDRFDVGRDHRRLRHLAFGFGEHFCLGAPLARLEARVVFEELLARFPRFELAGEPDLLESRLINGVERLPIAVDR